MAPVTASVDVQLPQSDVPHFSTAMLVEAFSTAEPNSPFAHSGVDLLPIVGAQVGFDASEMRYYLELYGVEHLPDESIYIANWLENEHGVELQGSRVYQRVNRALIVPIFQTRPWGEEAASSRFVVWEALTKTGESLCLERLALSVGGLVRLQERLRNLPAHGRTGTRCCATFKTTNRGPIPVSNG